MGITTHPGEEECEVSCAKLAVGHRKKAVSNHAKRNLSAWTCRGKWVRCDVLMGTVLVSLNIEFVISACGDGRLPGKDTTARSLPPRSCHCQLGGFKPTGDRCCKNVNVDFLARYFGEGQNAAYKPALLFIWAWRVCRAVQSPCRFVFPTSMISFAWSAETGCVGHLSGKVRIQLFENLPASRRRYSTRRLQDPHTDVFLVGDRTACPSLKCYSFFRR